MSSSLVLIIFVTLFTLAVGEHFDQCSSVAEDTFIGVENNCRSYIYCAAIGEESYQEECPVNTYFDANISECVVDEDGVCNKGSNGQDVAAEGQGEEDEGQHALQESSETENNEEIASVAPTVKPITASSNRPTCNRFEDSVHPHPIRCEYYYRCMRGYLTIFRCHLFHAWDYQKQMCVPRNEVQCYGNSHIRRFL
ncbi:uncharacterized protein LOC133335992 [Musca vetustissima]|uniref:uncharacterized protein LOC133335992 n=1 Tax=Musca vetustissima TaxID=27455 RepID=UPI002AB65588|nr:uncharacterized protein LOC133335992 [Musca vetustissima]